MKTVTINNFSGGLAEDLREQKTNTFAYASGFDTYSNSHKISPYRTTETETIDSGTLTDFKMTDVCIMKDSVNTNIYALGQVGSADTNAKFFQKATANDLTTAFQGATGGEDTTNVVVANTLVPYKERLYALKTDNTDSYLIQYIHSTGTLTTKADGGATTTLNGVALSGVRPFRHPKDDILYIAHGRTISKLDDTTLTRNVLALPSDLQITSLTDYGNYLAIATTPIVGGVNCKVYLWDRDSSLATLSEVLDFGEGTLNVLENIDGVLVGVMTDAIPVGAARYNIKPKLIVKIYAGGSPQVVKTVSASSTITLYRYKAKQSNKLYFACQGTFNGTATPFQIWTVSRTQSGWSVSQDRLVKDANEAITINGFNLIGDYLWVGFYDDADGRFYRTKGEDVTATYPTCTYESLINPSMETGDKTKKKKLNAISVAKSSTTGALTVYYKVDGGSYNTIGTLSASGSLVLKATNESTGIPFADGYEYQFKVESTSGAEFTELKYAYEVTPELI